MKSRISTLYDHTQADIPSELRLWRVSEKELDDQLASLSRSHAQENEVSEVQVGDSVVCQGSSQVPRWNKPVLLFYPSHNLCEKVIEDALVGMKTGESKTIAASEGSVTLTVSRILRREPHPINDELVKLEAMEGIETVADYRRWYRETTEERKRKHDLAYLGRHLLEEIIKKSEYEIDEAEELAWAAEHGEIARRIDEERGIDPTIPEDGVVFLTEEQVRQKYIDKCRPQFRSFLAYPAIVTHLSGMDEEKAFRTALEEMAQKYYNGTDPDELLKQAPEGIMRNQAFYIKAELLLRDYSEQLLED